MLFTSLLGKFTFVIYITFFLLILSTTFIFTNAFSVSWVYEDLLAHPQYKVIFQEKQLIPSSRIDNHVIEQDPNNVQAMTQIDQSSSEESKSTSIMMRTSTGQSYVCKNKDDNTNLMKKGLVLLEPLLDNCLYYINGWWTYEYCHMRHVKQFHQIIQAGSLIEDTSSESYFLGKTLGTDLEVGGGKKFLVQRWSDGTTCDLTGNPRRVEIQFHCNPQNYISVVTEMYTCNYLVVIHTSYLCAHPAFHDTSFSKINPIECRPVVPDAYYQRAIEKGLESGLKDKSSIKQHINEKDKTFDGSDNRNQQKQDLNQKNPESTDKNKKDAAMTQNKKQLERLVAIANKLLDQEYLRDLARRPELQSAEIGFNDDNTNQDDDREIKFFLYDDDYGKKASSNFDKNLKNLLINNFKKMGIFNANNNEKVLFEEQNNQKSHQAKLSKIFETIFDPDVVDDTNIDKDNEKKK
nr:4763_t:CDS:2 [Entrophospora candida]